MVNMAVWFFHECLSCRMNENGYIMADVFAVMCSNLSKRERAHLSGLSRGLDVLERGGEMVVRAL